MDESQDVNQIEQTTMAPSSEGQQTAPESVADAQTQETAAPQTVPYDRFKEINDELKATRQSVEELRNGFVTQNLTAQTPPVNPQEVAVKEQVKSALEPILKEMGFVSKQEIAQREQDQALDQLLSSLEKELDGKDGRPAFVRKEVVEYAVKNGIATPKAAYDLMHQPELINWHVQQAMTKGQGLKTEGSNGSGSQQVGVSDQDLKSAIARGDTKAKDLLLKRVAKNTFFRE